MSHLPTCYHAMEGFSRESHSIQVIQRTMCSCSRGVGRNGTWEAPEEG